MPAALNFTVAEIGGRSLPQPKTKLSMPFKNGTLYMSRFPLSHSKRAFKCPSVRMTLVDERLARGKVLVKPSEILAYDLVQGAHVKWSYIMERSASDPPTAVLLHGILGSRKNWGTFARRLAKEFPEWQFLLVDLRCHGDSASIKKRGPHSVASAALDVLKLLGQLRLTPRVLVGHSFGGKVALSIVEQAAKPLARPVRVWVLDATPGKVRAGGDGDDHPAELISFLNTLPNKVSSKRDVVNALVQQGFSMDVSQRWARQGHYCTVAGGEEQLEPMKGWRTSVKQNMIGAPAAKVRTLRQRFGQPRQSQQCLAKFRMAWSRGG